MNTGVSMSQFILRLLCKLFGHKGPHGTTYTLKRSSKDVVTVKWQCSRCNEMQRGLMLGYEQPGHIINSTPSFKPSILLMGGKDSADSAGVHVLG